MQTNNFEILEAIIEQKIDEKFDDFFSLLFKSYFGYQVVHDVQGLLSMVELNVPADRIFIKYGRYSGMLLSELKNPDQYIQYWKNELSDDDQKENVPDLN